jgi:hypothetical protein
MYLSWRPFTPPFRDPPQNARKPWGAVNFASHFSVETFQEYAMFKASVKTLKRIFVDALSANCP